MFRKILSPQMIGVAPLQLGSATRHVTFSSVVQRVGKFFSLLMPLRKGPRHCGQFSARTNLAESRVTRNESVSTRRTSSSPEENGQSQSTGPCRQPKGTKTLLIYSRLSRASVEASLINIRLPTMTGCAHVGLSATVYRLTTSNCLASF